MSESNTSHDSGDPVLSFSEATFGSSAGYDTAIAGVSFQLHPGDLCLVRLEWETLRLPIADLACGIVHPDSGSVQFEGEDWCDMGFGQSTRERGRIGRTFEGVEWVGNLDVDENVLLAERHHTRRPDGQLQNEAEALAREFGLHFLPQTRPAQTSKTDLARAALVRAFMGSPRLLLLERPANAAYPQIMPALLRKLKSARERGAAVLWLTNRPEIWQDADVRPSCRYAMSGSRMMPA